MSVDVEEIRWELQETHTTGDGESSSSVYNWSARCKRLDILEGPATSQAQIQIQIQIIYSFHKSIIEQEFMGCGDRQLRVMDRHTDNR
jgi:hypothetical protein